MQYRYSLPAPRPEQLPKGVIVPVTNLSLCICFLRLFLPMMLTKKILREEIMLIRLPKDGGFRIEADCRGIVIRCEEGILWITQTGDPDDHFLEPQQEFIISRKGTVMVEARRDACVAVTGAT